MKRCPKKILPTEFVFQDKTRQEFVDCMNEEFPIKIAQLKELTNKIHKRCPTIEKTEVHLILKNIAGAMRDILILGKIINIKSIFVDCKLHFYKFKNIPALRIKNRTPKYIRYINFNKDNKND